MASVAHGDAAFARIVQLVYCYALEVIALIVELEKETDGRWIAEVPDLPGVMAYGETRDEAVAGVKALALRVLADRLEHGEQVPELGEVFAVPA